MKVGEKRKRRSWRLGKRMAEEKRGRREEEKMVEQRIEEGGLFLFSYLKANFGP